MSNDNTRTIRPGIFVNIKTSVEGNVSYQRFDIVTGEKLDDGSEKSEWNTKKFVEDPEELDRATKVRGAARSMIEKLCSKTTLGLWCGPEQKGALDAARDAADVMVAEFNRTAKRTRLWLSVIPSRLEADDTRALRDIMREVSRLVQQMDESIKEVDAEKIREAAREARQLSSMLTDDNKIKVNAAVDQAYKAAAMITKRVGKAGEDAKMVLLDIQRSQIESARIAFLDLTGETQPVEQVMPAVQAQRFADLDMGDAEEAPKAPSCAPVQMDLSLNDESDVKAKTFDRNVNVPTMELV